MAYVLGIDIGTSYTAAAVARWEGEAPAPPQALCLGTRQSAVPSVIFLGDDGQVMVGEAAERRAMTQPERVVRAFKRRVGDAVPIVAGAGSITPTDALALMARWVVDRAQEREGAPPEHVTLTHPAGWGEHKLGLLRESLATVGLADATLLNEPEAAVQHYASQQRVEAGSTVAVYDLGGGTFDAAILRKDGADSFELLGRPEGIEWLGGADFDDAVFGHVAASPDAPLAGLDPSDPDVLMALSRVRRECTEAKEALSYDSEASIPILLPGRQTRIRLVRQEFEALIEGPVRHSIDTLDRTLQAAHVEPADLAVILLVGGSSRVPLISQLLSAEFNRPIAVDVDPKASVCLGAACSAAARLSAPEAGAGHGQEDERTPEPTRSGPGPLLARHPSSRRPGRAVLPRPAVARAVAPDARSGTRLRRRLTAVGATLAALTVLTATTAQTPSGLDPAAPLAAAARVGALAEGVLSPAWHLPAQEVANRQDADGATLAAAPGRQLPGAMDDAAAPAADPLPEAVASDAPSAVPEAREQARTGPGTPLAGPEASPRGTRTPTVTPGSGAPSAAVPGATGPQSPVTGPGTGPGTGAGPEVPAPTQEPQPTPPVTPPTPGPVTSPPAPEPEPTSAPTPDPAPTPASPAPATTEGPSAPASSEGSPVSDDTAPVPAPATDPSALPKA